MEKKESKRTGLLLIALFLGYTMVYIDKMSVGYSLIPISEEFGLEPAAKGMIMSAFFLGYALMQIPMGLVINKAGSRIVLIGSVLGMGLFSLLFGFGTSLIMFMSLRFLTGFLAHSGYASSASKEVTVNFAPEKRTFAQGILLSSAGVAGFIGPLVLSPIITKAGWKNAYLILTVVAVLIAVFLILVIPKKEKIEEQKIAVATKTDKLSIWQIWSDLRVWIIFFSAFFLNCILYGLSNWLPSFLTGERGLDLNGAAIVSSVGGLFMLIGSIGGSYIVGRFFQNMEKTVVAVTAVLGTLATFSSYFIGNLVLLSLVMGLANFFLIISFVSMMSIPLKIFEGAKFAPSYSTLATGGILGGFVAPTLIGQLVELSGGQYISTFYFFLVAGLLTAVTILFVKQK
ncbi:MFS transporter [Enterococcus wangshanyuanii]|uniref:MFS transporter n=1 Tax=Enterococcus wangshanyuanii TaxID=2005703 RepID=A0ABQ1NXW9_9ENTE|nr:MFS transporter [Enterococcus wangshanyuanii]GGC86811.1 MFS transporter [Enterococcus wangshanyuanii]